MKTVGTFEGKTHFSRLVSEAEAGETILITRNGRVVAQLGPVPAPPENETAKAAFARLLAMDQTLGIDVRTLIDEGRRR